MKRLVLFVEGAGDVAAVPVLVRKLLTEKDAWDCVHLDDSPFEIKGLHNFTGRRAQNWPNKLQAAARRKNFGGVLLLLDGDTKHYRDAPFCAATAARALADAARKAGAGEVFSVSVVFACREYESWLLAGAGSLAGQPPPDRRPGIPAGAPVPEGDFEESHRNAKKWFKETLPNGYNPPIDQKPLTQLVDLEEIRARKMRSFQRLESALDQIIDAFRGGTHIVSPCEG